MTKTELITLTASILLAARVCEDRKEAIKYASNLIEITRSHLKELEQELKAEHAKQVNSSWATQFAGRDEVFHSLIPPLSRHHTPTCNAVLLLDEAKCNCVVPAPEDTDTSNFPFMPIRRNR